MSDRKPLPTCESCNYWSLATTGFDDLDSAGEHVEDDGTDPFFGAVGICQRFPPTKTMDEVDNVYDVACYPVARPGWRCGEHQPATVATQDVGLPPFAEFLAKFNGVLTPNMIASSGVTDWETLFSPKQDPMMWRNCGNVALGNILKAIADLKVPAPAHWTIPHRMRKQFLNDGGRFAPTVAEPPAPGA